MHDQLVGLIRFRFKDIKEQPVVYKWGNIYGPPLGEEDEMMTVQGQSLGSHYRGRLLYSATSMFH